jgi:hypothetical protein
MGHKWAGGESRKRHICSQFDGERVAIRLQIKEAKKARTPGESLRSSSAMEYERNFSPKETTCEVPARTLQRAPKDTLNTVGARELALE